MRISVVTPSFNQGRFIEETIRSVLMQTHKDVEYLVLDNCSTDQTGEILANYREKIDHLKIEPDHGQADAIARGFEISTGDICCYLNSDDVLLPGSLEYVASFFSANPDVDAIYGHRVYQDSESRYTNFWILPPHSNYLMERWDYIPQETCFWRRHLMDRAGGIDSAYRFAMDYDFFVRAMRIGKFKRVNKFLAAFREHDSSKTVSQYDTVGIAEVGQVRRTYDISISQSDEIISRCFAMYMSSAAAVFRWWIQKFPSSFPSIARNFHGMRTAGKSSKSI